MWAKKKPVAEFGPDIEFREYSLLEHPRMPRAVLESRVVVVVGDAAPSAAVVGAPTVELGSALSDEDARAVFAPLKDVKA